MTMRFERMNHAQSFVMDGERIIVDTEHGVVTQLNEVGGFVWECLERGAEMEELVNSVLERYEISRQQVVQDIVPFVESLIQLRLIRDNT